MDKKKEKEGWADLLASTRVTLYTLIALGLAILAGTLIPQRGISLTEEVLQQKITEPIWRIFHLVGLLDVFHSVWFLLLVGLLCTNLVLCTYRYVLRIQKQLAATGPILDEQTRKRVPMVEEIKVTTSPETAINLLTKWFGKVGKVEKNEQNGAVYLFAQNSPLTRYAIIILHLSVLFIVAGGLIRLLMGIEGQMLIPEGGEQNIFEGKNGSIYRLPYDVHCSQFEVEFYDDGQQPKDYRSTLVLVQNDSERARKTIEVNDPLIYKGFHFFQSTYGTQTFAILQIKRLGKPEKELPVFFNRVQSISGSVDGLIVDDVREGEDTLAIHVKLTERNQIHQEWLVEKGEAVELGTYEIAFIGHKRGQYTGIMVTADPGSKLVWLGISVFFFALFWVMFFSHRRVWARVDSSQIVLAASAQKQRERMSDWLKQVKNDIEQA